MRLWTNTGLYFKGGAGGLFLDTGAGPSFLPLPSSVLEQVAAGNVDSGVTTIRMPEQQQQQQHQQRCTSELQARDVDVEVCFVCKKCRVGFAGDSALLTHQRHCYGGNLEARGAFRIVQTGYECKLCNAERFKSLQEFRKHCESDSHMKVLKVAASKSLPPPSESPLSHEMEDVVNQIALLAARAAQESGPEVARDSNSNNTFCQPSDQKRRYLAPPGDVPQQPLTSAGH